MSRSHPFTAGNTAKNECIKFYGIFKREKQFDDIPKIWEYEICVSKPRILV